MPRHEDTTPLAQHPMPARTSPKCSGFDTMPPVRPNMAEIMHGRAALRTECLDQWRSAASYSRSVG